MSCLQRAKTLLLNGHVHPPAVLSLSPSLSLSLSPSLLSLLTLMDCFTCRIQENGKGLGGLKHQSTRHVQASCINTCAGFLHKSWHHSFPQLVHLSNVTFSQLHISDWLRIDPSSNRWSDLVELLLCGPSITYHQARVVFLFFFYTRRGIAWVVWKCL